jgi:hypothetical protein
MKKYLTLLLITSSIATQTLKAQLDMVFISDFSVTSDNYVNRLTWTIGNNHGANRFYVERSTKGNDFKTVAVLTATEKFSTESYTHSDTTTRQDTIMYRLRILSKTLHVFYSRVVFVKSKMTSNNNIKIIGNPAKDKVSLSYNSTTVQQADLKIYNLYGNVVFNQKIASLTGENLLTIPLSSDFAPGMYVIEMNNGFSSQTAKFIKN